MDSPFLMRIPCSADYLADLFGIPPEARHWLTPEDFNRKMNFKWTEEAAQALTKLNDTFDDLDDQPLIQDEREMVDWVRTLASACPGCGHGVTTGGIPFVTTPSRFIGSVESLCDVCRREYAPLVKFGRRPGEPVLSVFPPA